MPPSARELAVAIEEEAAELAPFILWRLDATAAPHQHSLRQIVADAFVIALQELGAVHVSRSVAEIRVPGGSCIYEHMHAHLPPEAILAAAAAFQRVCGGPSLIGQALHDWEVRGSWTYARAEPPISACQFRRDVPRQTA
jgi:hypothetical protein